jgi:hypothetical protein
MLTWWARIFFCCCWLQFLFIYNLKNFHLNGGRGGAQDGENYVTDWMPVSGHAGLGDPD